MNSERKRNVNLYYRIARFLILLGLNWRSIVILEVFLLLFIFGSLIFLYIQNPANAFIWLILICPLMVLATIFSLLLLHGHTKFKKILLEAGRKYQAERPPLSSEMFGKIWSLLHVAMACLGTSVGILIILVTALVAFGMADVIELFFLLYCTIGVPLVFLLFWRFYSRKLRQGQSE